MDNQRYLKNVATLEYDASLCIGCRLCVEVCPHNVFRMKDKRAEILDKDKCMECGACAINCSPQALTVEKGVGCAAAVIFGFINGTEPNCDCGPSSSSCC